MPPQQLSASYKQGHINLDTFSPVDQNGSFCFDRVIKSGKVQRRVKNKGAWKASWKPAYLVLRPNLLSIYKNEDETDLRASIGLSDITAIAKVRKSHSDNVFGIFSPAKNHHFLAPSERDAEDWINQIRLEARPDDLESLDPPDPAFSRQRGNSSLSQGFETTDLSADDSPEPPASPPASASRPKSKSYASPPAQHQTKRPRAGSTLQDYNEHNTPSVSDFSDFQPGSLPKNQSSHLKAPPLSPIMSTPQLRPPLQQRNVSQLSITQQDMLADPERVIRQGWLQILKSKTGGIKGWKTLWVVLRPKNVGFYKNEQEYSAVKILSMSNIIDAAEIDSLSKTKQYCFQIIVEEKAYKLCAPDEEALAKWLGSLKSVLSKRNEIRKGKEKGIMEGTKDMTIRS
jgi:hypothetical protein